MQDLIAELANKTNPQRKLRKYPDQLYLRYGKIGISAVAAAARYQSVTKIVAEPDYHRPAFA